MIHTLNLDMEISFHEVTTLSDAIAELCKHAKAAFYRYNDVKDKSKVIKVFNLYKKHGLTIKICKNDKSKYARIDIRLNPIKLINQEAIVETTKEADLISIEDEFCRLMTPIYNRSIKRLIQKGVILSEDDLEMVKGRMGRIADITDMKSYRVRRIDYCIDVRTELSDKYMELIRRGDVPSRFIMKMDDNLKTGKSIRYKDSMYLQTKSKDITINFYNKEKEMEGNPHYDEHEKLGSQNMLRFEVQCIGTKLNNLKAKYGFDSKDFKKFSFNQLALEIINSYYNEVVGKNDYVTLRLARKIVESSKQFKKIDKKNMIEVLELINEKRSMCIARDEYINTNEKPKYARKRFNTILAQIESLYINPVTLPVNWGIERLPNLYDELIRAGALPNQAVVTFGI